jgi:hypothetical protein
MKNDSFIQNTNEIISWISALNYFAASWKLFELPGGLVSNINIKETYRKPQKASRKLPVRYKKFQGRTPEINSLVAGACCGPCNPSKWEADI